MALAQEPLLIVVPVLKYMYLHFEKYLPQVFFKKYNNSLYIVSRMTSQRSSKGNGVEATVFRNADGNVLVSGRLDVFAGHEQEIRYIAPKGIHRGFSFAGSGLPYHNADQAFDGTQNKGVVHSTDGKFAIELDTLPSAYYTGLGSTYIPPVLLLETTNMNTQDKFKTHLFLSPVGVPYRWIAGAPSGPRVGPREGNIGRAMYYDGREQLPLFQNQEMLCRYKGYPSDEAAYGLPGPIDHNPWDDTPAPA